MWPAEQPDGCGRVVSRIIHRVDDDIAAGLPQHIRLYEFCSATDFAKYAFAAGSRQRRLPEDTECDAN
jgi:hypothetical protein